MDILEFGNIYPNMVNLITVGLMAVIFITIMKYLTVKFAIPGVSDIMASI